MTRDKKLFIGGVAAVVAVTLVGFFLMSGALGRRGGVEALPELEFLEGQSFETEDTLPSALTGVAIELVEGRTGPGGEPFYVALRTRTPIAYASRPFGGQTMPIGLRSNAEFVSQYPCTSCHLPGGRIRGRPAADEDAVHQNIRPVHPSETGAQCQTCHAAGDPGRLLLARGGTAGLDHSYRTCAQCHSTQVESWAMGAHGKRLVGWRGRRVVMGCAECHDPHAPETELRLPYPGPQLPTPLRGDAHD